MSGKYLIGLDAGGGGGRCLLVNSATAETTSVFRPWTLPPAPEIGGFAYKLDTAGVWRTLGEAVQEALKKAGVTPQEVAGLAATSMRHSTIVLDKKGSVLLAAPNRDARAAGQGMQLAIERGEELYKITGHSPSPVFTAARLLWLKETQPEAFQSAHAVLSFSDWVGYMLSDETATEQAQAGESLILDLKSRKVASAVIKSMDIAEKILPRLKNAGTRLGKLTKEAAADLGLVPGIPVAVGGPDTQCGLLGMGVVSSGQIGVVAGTTTPIQMAVAEPLLDPEMHLWTGLHVIPGLYVLESNAGQMGSSLDWFAHLMHGEAPNPVAMLAAEAEASTPGAHGTLSTIGAAVFNAAAMEPPVDALTFSSVAARLGDEARSDVARAILEGMAYAVRANIEQILKVSGGAPSELWLSGGITRSALWTQIISDVMGCKVHVSATAEASALGAAICAGVGAGIFRDLATGAQKLANVAREQVPGPSSATYQSLYADWQSLRSERRPADIIAINQFTDALMAGLDSGGEGEGAAASFRPKIYISAEVDEAALGRLRTIGDVTYKPYRTEGILLTGDDLVQTLKGVQVFVTEVDIVDAAALFQLPDLRMIVVCRGNPVNIDIEACSAASVPVTNTPARNADAVADLAVSFVLMLARKLQPASAFLRQPGGEAGDLGRMGQAHEEFLGVELWRKTIGVVGGGAIGRKVIQRLLPFGARLLLFDPFLSSEQAVLMGAEKVSFERLLAESDFVSLHAPVVDATLGMMNAAAFERMKPGAYLVNTARAALVNDAALQAALRSGRLRGYATDVFTVEPPGADDPLLAFPNVVATPHMGGNTLEVAAHQGEIIASELRLLLAGKSPKYILNAAALESFTWTGSRKTDEAALKARAQAPGPGTTDLDVAAQKEKAVEVKTETIPAAAPQPASPTGKVESMDTSGARQKMIEIMKDFTARIVADKEMNSFAKGKNVVFLFTVKDLDQSFFMSFVDGKADSGLGAPPREPDVKLKMAADILDGMFTGRINASKAATSGKLSFSGDTGKAMSFIRIQGNMGKLYTEARTKIGDPGDLTKLGAAPAPAPAPASASLPSPAGGGQGVMPAVVKTGDVRDQILMVTNELYAKGLITATGGNVSARCDDNPNEIWITPSAIFKGDLRPDMMVRIDLNGKIISDTDYTASSERRVHCNIYKNMPDITAVIHSHAPNATLMALTGTKFAPISADAAFFGDIPVVPFIMPGTDELGELVGKAVLANGIAALMQNHGLVVAGSSLRRAADMTDMIEVTAQKILTCKMLSVEPALLPEDVVKQLKEIGSAIA
jgi:autoinducer 2 (AI-2) kinase